MCDVVEWCDSKFRIVKDDYVSDYYSDLRDLRMNDIYVLRANVAHSKIPYDIYLSNLVSGELIARKQVWFKIDKWTDILGEYWLVLSATSIVLKWAVFDYDVSFMFTNLLMKCDMFDTVNAVNSTIWREFDYDNCVIPWIINNTSKHLRKNVHIDISAIISDRALRVENSERIHVVGQIHSGDPCIVKIIWDYLICDFDEIDYSRM